jgi:hypothetical protein
MSTAGAASTMNSANGVATGYLTTVTGGMPFLPTGESHIATVGTEWLNHGPVTFPSPAGGVTVRFQPPAQGIAKRIFLRMKFSAVTASTGGTQRLSDYAGYYGWTSARILDKGKVIQEISPEYCMLRNETQTRDIWRDGRRALVGGGKSVAARKTASANEQEFLVELPFWFTTHMGQSLDTQWMRPEIVIDFVNFSKIIEVDGGDTRGTTSVTMTELDLKIEHAVLTHPQRSLYEAAAHPPSGRRVSARYLSEYREIIPSGSTVATIDLKALGGQIYCLNFYFVQTADLAAFTYIKPDNYDLTMGSTAFDTEHASKFRINASGVNIVDMTHFEERTQHATHLNLFESTVDATTPTIYRYSWATHPDYGKTSSGSLAWHTLSAPTLHLTFGQATPAECEIVMVAESHSYIDLVRDAFTRDTRMSKTLHA